MVVVVAKRSGSEFAACEKVLIKMTIKNPSNKERLLRSANLGTEYCSIHRTISMVADIKLEVDFVD